MTDLPDTSPNLGLPFYQTKLNEFEVQHNEALLMLDALVMLAVKDRDLSAPPSSPALGDRYLVKPTGTGDFAGKDNRIAQYDTGGWNFYPPQTGWTCYVQDELVLLAWDGDSWEPALDVLGSITEIENLNLLGIGTTADTTNPLSAKLNNVLCLAKTVAEGGDGTLRYKISKENASKTASFLFQDNLSGRAEIGLTGDDDFHFKVSADGTTWVDALILDKTTGAARLNGAVSLTGDVTPSQITADQNDYNPTGLAGASVLRLSTDASRNVTGLAGGADGRVAAVVNAGSNNIVLKDASASSSAANRFAFGADLTLAAKQSAVLWYDATDSRWKLLAGPQAASGGVPADLDITLAELALGLADAMNVAQFLGGAGNRFADSFDALTDVNTGGATNLDSGTAGLLKPTVSNTRLSGGTPTAPFGGTAANFNDNNAGTVLSASSIGDLTAAAAGSRIVAKIDYGSNQTITKIEALQFKNDFGSAAGHSFLTSTDGTTWTQFGTTFTVTSTLADYSQTAGPVTARYIALALNQANYSGHTQTLGDFNGYTGTTSNLTVQSQSLAAAAAPTSMKIVALVNHVDSATAGTDYKFKVSRDGGSHLSGYLTLNNRFTMPGGSLHVIESDAIDVSGITSGTTPLWQFETLNNKAIELQGVYFYWS